MNNNLLRRIKASKEGAFIMGGVYILLVALMYLFNVKFYELPNWIMVLLAPAALLAGIDTSEQLVMGLPMNLLFISFVMYAGIGYLIDWFHEPYK